MTQARNMIEKAMAMPALSPLLKAGFGGLDEGAIAGRAFVLLGFSGLSVDWCMFNNKVA
jgi:hypothetical protein